LYAAGGGGEKAYPPGLRLGTASVLTAIMTAVMIKDMESVKRITANLPAGLLDDAMAVTGKGITETLVEGLQLVRQRRAYQKAMALKGKLQLDIDLEELRDRSGRRHFRVD